MLEEANLKTIVIGVEVNKQTLTTVAVDEAERALAELDGRFGVGVARPVSVARV